MIFQHTHRQIMAGKKTVTRRLVKPDDIPIDIEGACGFYRHGNIIDYICNQRTIRIKYKIDGIYPCQPGRNKKAFGWIKIKSIRYVYLNDITVEDIIKEGFPGYTKKEFIEMFKAIYKKKKDSTWNPGLWRIEFEFFKSKEEANR